MKYKAVAIVLGVVLVAMIALFGNLFRVREVSVEYVGASPTEADPADVYSVCAIETNGSILNLNENEIREYLSQQGLDKAAIDESVKNMEGEIRTRGEERARVQVFLTALARREKLLTHILIERDDCAHLIGIRRFEIAEESLVFRLARTENDNLNVALQKFLYYIYYEVKSLMRNKSGNHRNYRSFGFYGQIEHLLKFALADCLIGHIFSIIIRKNVTVKLCAIPCVINSV